MKALVTGAAGFIGSHLSERLLEAGATVIGVDCFTDYYPRELQGAQPGAPAAGAAASRWWRRPLADADLPALLDGVTHVFHLAAQAGVRKSWGRDFRVYTVNNVEATQILLEACVGRPIERLVYASSSSVYGDDVPLPMREDARPQPVSPYGVTKLAAEQLCHLYHVNHSVPTVSLRYFTVYGPRQRPDMGFHAFLRGRACGTSRCRSSATAGRPATSPSWPTPWRRPWRRPTRGKPGGVYNIGGGSRVELLDVFELIGRDHGPAAASRTARGAARRHARHLCGYDAGARRPGVRADASRSNRACARSTSGWQRTRILSTETSTRVVVAVLRSRAPSLTLGRVRRRAARRRRPARRSPTASSSSAATRRCKKEQWLNARDYFQQIVDNYPQSPFRPDAKLGVGDSYLGEDTPESLVLAANEFREFLHVLPDQPARRLRAVQARDEPFRADARGRARSDRNARGARRSSTSSSRSYPNSPLTPEVKQNWRDRPRSPERGARTASACTYYRIRWYPGRHRPLPRSPQGRPRLTPAGTPSTSIWRSRWPGPIRRAEAIPYFERLLDGVRAERVPGGRAEAARKS